MKQTWPAPERNKVPILEVLARVLPPRGTMLEISSGSGQHAAFFARELPAWTITPSDVDAENLASIRAYQAESGLSNLHAPLTLDVCDDPWEVGTYDAIFNANMVHIAPWACAEGLMRGVGRHLAETGVLVMYGPFKVSGAHTAESNASFDASLRARDARWGVRDVSDLATLAQAAGLRLRERVAMPANNFTLVFSRV